VFLRRSFEKRTISGKSAYSLASNHRMAAVTASLSAHHAARARAGIHGQEMPASALGALYAASLDWLICLLLIYDHV
jgi:hypothetical protein